MQEVMLFLVNSLVVFGFPDFYLVAVRSHIAHPLGQVLRRWTERKYGIEILMVDARHYIFLDIGEIRHHSILIESLRLAMNDYDPVVTMQFLAFAAAFCRDMMSSGDLETLAYVIH